MEEVPELDIAGFTGELSSRLRVHLQPETVLNPEHDAIHPEDVLDAVCGIMDSHGYDTDRFCDEFRYSLYFKVGTSFPLLQIVKRKIGLKHDTDLFLPAPALTVAALFERITRYRRCGRG